MKIGHYTIIIYNMLKLSKYSERNENKFAIRIILRFLFFWSGVSKLKISIWSLTVKTV